MSVKNKDKFIVFGKPFISNEDIKEVVDTLKSGWWGTGPKTEKFEQQFKEYVGSKYSLAVNSATAGLHIALKSLGVGPGDEVITTPLTFCSTVNVIMHCGATPVFADVLHDEWNIDPKEIEKKINKKTKVILPVHLHGRPAKMDAIMKLARKNKLHVVEDAAHAVESWYKGKKIGSIADITVFSFYVTKNLSTAEGGMVTSNNKKLIERMKVLSLHGLSRDAYKRYSVKEFRTYDCLTPGFKYNMTDIQASLGIHQLSRIESNLIIRKKIWDIYNQEFLDFPLLQRPKEEDTDTVHARHLYAILLDLKHLKITRNQFIDILIKENVGSGVHFNPVHLLYFYKKTFNFKKGDYPNSEYIGERIVSLPIGANLKAKDIKKIANTIKNILDKNKK